VGADGIAALVLDVLPVLIGQFEAGSEIGFFQGGEGCGDLVGRFGALFSHWKLAHGNIANINHTFSRGCWNGKYPVRILILVKFFEIRSEVSHNI
jgi:hypothetical protein